MELSRILEIDIKINEIKTSIKFYLVPKFDFGKRGKKKGGGEQDTAKKRINGQQNWCF